MLERWQGALDEATQAVAGDAKLAATLKDGGLSSADKDKALAAALSSETPTEVLNLLKLMWQEDDLSLLPEIAGALTEVVSGQQAPLKAEIVSAVELDSANQKKIRTMLIAQYGEGLVFDFQVDPSLMGGLRLRVGDHLIDNSVASRLTTLRESLSAVVR
jgi:F-type H+-transporting ATPase subunit delta